MENEKKYIKCVFCEKGVMYFTNKNTCYCPTCEQETDPIQLVMRVKNISYEKAIEFILDTKETKC